MEGRGEHLPNRLVLYEHELLFLYDDHYCYHSRCDSQQYSHNPIEVAINKITALIAEGFAVY